MVNAAMVPMTMIILRLPEPQALVFVKKNVKLQRVAQHFRTNQALNYATDIAAVRTLTVMLS